ncbi:MAG: acyl-CoA dehydrogenase family protein [Desulfobacula sp.]|nr:acyl-CoA dehydrogenase family protein [Desulfobacula sp.]
MGCFDICLIMEEFSRIDPGCGCILLSDFGAEIIQLYGTLLQKQKYLPPLPMGKAIMGTAITESDAGSDLFAIKTKAQKVGDEYVINGSKMFITNGTIADYIAVYCVTDPEAESRYNRHSIVLVETDREGFEARKIKGKLGIRASDTAELAFSNVKVPVENLIGEKEGDGFAQIMSLFNTNRVIAAAQELAWHRALWTRRFRMLSSVKLLVSLSVKTREFSLCWLKWPPGLKLQGF